MGKKGHLKTTVWKLCEFLHFFIIKMWLVFVLNEWNNLLRFLLLSITFNILVLNKSEEAGTKQ